MPKSTYKRRQASPTRTSYSRSTRPTQAPDRAGLKDLVFFQATACGILVLGLLVLVMISTNAPTLRDTIASAIGSNELTLPAFEQTLVQPDTEPAMTPTDFDIDEALLDDVIWRQNLDH